KNEPIDEAKAAGKTTADFPQITADIFKPMDGGIDLSPEEIMGRNTWNLWSGGNQHFWNQAAQDSYGLMDLLKMLDNRKFPRGDRFKTLGLVNEPGFRAAGKPDEFGLWLDEQVEPEPAGVDATVYGKPSGVLGFRLFPNPEFNGEARKKWDGDRFMNDPTYYNDKKRVRPDRGAGENGRRNARPAERKRGDERAAYFEGWRGFNRGTWRNDSRLRQHRNVFRILVDAAQPLDRAHPAKTVRDFLCAGAFGFLA